MHQGFNIEEESLTLKKIADMKKIIYILLSILLWPTTYAFPQGYYGSRPNKGERYNILGQRSFQNQDYASAIDNYLRAEEIFQAKKKYKDSYSRMKNLRNISECYYEIGEYNKCIDIAKFILNNYDSDRWMNMRLWNLIADSYYNIAEYTKSIEYLNIIINNTSVVDEKIYSLYKTAACSAKDGNNIGAIEFSLKAVNLINQQGVTFPFEYAYILHNLIYFFETEKDISNAILYANILRETYENNHQCKNEKYALLLGNLSLYYSVKCQYEESILYGEKAARLLDEYLITNLSIEYALFNSYEKLGKYSRAIYWGKKLESIYGDEEYHEQLLDICNRLATCYIQINDLRNSYSYINKCLDICSHQDYKHLTPVILKNFLQLVGYLEKNNRIELIKEIIAKYENDGYTESTYYAEWLSELSSQEMMLNDMGNAVSLQNKAYEIIHSCEKEMRANFIQVYLNGAHVFTRLRDYNNAKQILIEAKECCNKANYKDYLDILFYLYFVNYNLKEFEETHSVAQEYINIFKEFIIYNISGLIDSQKKRFLGKYLDYATLVLSTVKNESITSGLYDALLMMKSLQVSIDAEFNNMIHNDENLRSLRSEQNRQKIPQNNYQDTNSNTIDEKESRIVYEVNKNYDFNDILHVNVQNIEGNLGIDDVSIEFFAPSLYITHNDGKIIKALLLRKGWAKPKLVELCGQEDIMHYHSLGADTYTKNNSYKLYNLIWSKLEPYINEGDNVYFSPMGLLHQMNIEVFQDANGKRANEKWNLHRVSSTRELCLEKPEIDMTSAVLYGNLLYDVDSTTMVAQSRTYRQEDNYVASRGFVQDSTMRNGWKKLDATNTEINSIAIMMQNSGIEPTIYRLEAGNEESFKALSGKKTPIIHLATHGFFYKDEEAKTKTFFETLDMNKNNYALDNSLKRSGLILAGAQKAWLGEPIPDNVEDGVLLAEEIATMDLTGTDLVVLSACETGLGEITSEGVFGLQRAFKKAGVQTLIMSLWKVDDNATSLFMRTFYKQWLGGKSKHAAFLDAQAAVRECKEHDYSNPYYWASFIMLD